MLLNLKYSFHILFVLILLPTIISSQRQSEINLSNKRQAPPQSVIITNAAGDTLFMVSDEGSTGAICLLPGATPSSTSDKLYNENGILKFNGSPISFIYMNDLQDAKYDGSSLFIGENAGMNDDAGASDNVLNFNTGVGKSALTANNIGRYNSALGISSLLTNTKGDRNTAIGSSTMAANQTGSNNVGIGSLANYNNVNGDNNTIIGTEAGRGTNIHDKSGSVFIGYRAGYYETNNNKLYIENSNSSSPLIYGDFTDGSEVVEINGDFHVSGNITSNNLIDNDWNISGNNMTSIPSGNVGIGTSNPNSKLSVGGAGSINYGIYSVHNAERGRAMHGHATATTGDNETFNYGGYFISNGPYGRAVRGEAVENGNNTANNFGGYFTADGTSGHGIYAEASNSRTNTVNRGAWLVSLGPKGEALYAQTSGSNGRSVYAFAGGSNSKGVEASGRQFDFYASGPGTNYGASSSRRWKNNIQVIDQPLKKISSLRGVYYDWDRAHGGKHDIGMIAEEVGEILPEIVDYEENGIDAIGMDYSKLTPLLVEAIKAQQEIIDKLKTENIQQRKEHEALNSRLNSLEEMVLNLLK